MDPSLLLRPSLRVWRDEGWFSEVGAHMIALLLGRRSLQPALIAVAELRDDIFAEQFDRVHDVLMLEPADLHDAQDVVRAGLFVPLELLDALVGIADNHHVALIDLIE